jgi:hypothetical protein
MDVDDYMVGVYTRLPAKPSVTIGGASTAIEAKWCGDAPMLKAQRHGTDPRVDADCAWEHPASGSGEGEGCG